MTRPDPTAGPPAGCLGPYHSQVILTSDLPSKVFLVDAYNVIFQDQTLRARARHDLSGARELLLELLSPLRVAGMKFVLVFDGERPGEQDVGGIRVIFTGSKTGETADHRLWHLAVDGGQGESIVISSDRKVVTGAGRRAGEVWPPERFLAFVRTFNKEATP